MAFRFLLVGAVAALGFDLPQGIDVDAWTHSGQAWWHARAAEFEARHGIALAAVEEAPAPEAATGVEAAAPAEDDDAAFNTVIEDVVASFAADEASGSTAEPEKSSQLVAGVVDTSFGPAYADALNRWADGLSEPAEPASLASPASPIAVDLGSDPIVVPISGPAGTALAFAIGSPSDSVPLPPAPAEASADVEVAGQVSPIAGGSRFVEAVRLTGQALQAWAALVQPGVPTTH